MLVGLLKEDHITVVPLLRTKFPESSREAEETPRLAVPELQTRFPEEPLTRRRSPEGRNFREAVESTAPESPPAVHRGMRS